MTDADRLFTLLEPHIARTKAARIANLRAELAHVEAAEGWNALGTSDLCFVPSLPRFAEACAMAARLLGHDVGRINGVMLKKDRYDRPRMFTVYASLDRNGSYCGSESDFTVEQVFMAWPASVNAGGGKDVEGT